jgi:hypothetical protein
MRAVVNVIFAYLASVIIATLLASIFSTQFVIAGLNEAGASISMTERISMTGYDFINMGKLYGMFIALGLAIAFVAAVVVYHFAKVGRPIVYIVAGMMCFIVMLHLMKAVFFDVQLIAGARSLLGLAFQALAGGIAGYAFAWLTRPTKPGIAEG